MPPLNAQFRSILLLPFLQSTSAGASNSTTVIPNRRGFVAEPDCGRGTVGILWQCLSTIFLCIYTAVHVDVPLRPVSSPNWFLHKLIWVFMGVLIPELVCVGALIEFVEARRLKSFWNRYNTQKIDLTQAHFLYAGGLHIVSKVDDKVLNFPSLVKSMHKAIQDVNATWPIQLVTSIDGKVPDHAEIDAKSKADTLAKMVTCAQALWTMVQILGRLAERLPVCTLEVSTAAYVVLATVSYTFWWKKPYDIGAPSIVHCTLPEAVRTLKIHPLKFHPLWLPKNKNWRRYPENEAESVDQDDLRMLAEIVLFSAAFSSIHCGAWRHSLPTEAEAILWRTSALVIGIWPLFLLLNGFLRNIGSRIRLPNYVNLSLILLYFAARVFLIIENFIEFRSAPADIYKQVSWPNYLGHIGS